MENIVLDVRGEQCPIPVVRALKAIRELTGPAVLEVHVDHELAVQNLLRMAAGNRYTAKSQRLEPEHFVVTIQVDHLAAAPDAEPAVCLPDQRGDLVVQVGTRTMGVGSDELGETLMKGFLYAVAQGETLPQTMLFYNGGAYLTTEGSPALEDLKNLEAQGVEILTCGTCLDYYGIKDKLAVGGVTNMYAIVEKLSRASRVLRP
jgi:selenium metabolism protein YedF